MDSPLVLLVWIFPYLTQGARDVGESRDTLARNLLSEPSTNHLVARFACVDFSTGLACMDFSTLNPRRKDIQDVGESGATSRRISFYSPLLNHLGYGFRLCGFFHRCSSCPVLPSSVV